MHQKNCCFANLNLLASFAVPVAVAVGVAYNKLPINAPLTDFIFLSNTRHLLRIALVGWSVWIM